MNRCLLIIDAQEAWRDKKSLFFIGDLKNYIKITNWLLDWAHKNRIPVIFSLHRFKKDGSDVLPYERGQMDDFLAGNPRAELVTDLKTRPSDMVLVKNRFSVFSNKKFNEILKSLKIKELIIGGITTNCCVRCSVIDAYNLGYKITLIKEACASGSKKTDNFTFRDLDSLLFGITIISFKNLGP